jgi:hypothetical protein
MASPKARIVTAPDPQTGIAAQVEVVTATSPEEMAKAADWARKDLEAARAENPDVKPTVVVVDGSAAALQLSHELDALSKDLASRGAAVETAELPAEAEKNLRTRFKDWFLNHYRVSFAITRLVIGTGMVGWGLVMSPDIPWRAAFTIGAASGVMAAAYQYYNGPMQKWVVGKGEKIRPWLKSYVLSVAFLGVCKAAALYAGTEHNVTALGIAGSVAKAALLQSLTFSPWALAVAGQERLANEKMPSAAKRARFVGDLKIFGLAIVSVGLSVAQMLQVPLAEASVYAFGVAGGASYAWTLFKSKRLARERAAACEAKLTL